MYIHLYIYVINYPCRYSELAELEASLSNTNTVTTVSSENSSTSETTRRKGRRQSASVPQDPAFLTRIDDWSEFSKDRRTQGPVKEGVNMYAPAAPAADIQIPVPSADQTKMAAAKKTE